MNERINKTLKSILRPKSGAGAALRDISFAIGAVILIMMILWGYTGQPFLKTAPMVVIESGSMMHDGSSYGKLGTIDPGDLVLVKDVDERSDVDTFFASSIAGERERYGREGDVIVYYPLGNILRTPIIHRAICWVEVYGSGDSRTFTISELGMENASDVTISDFRVYNYKPSQSGFITAGNHNVERGGGSDQTSGICPEPVQVNWIIGKARGEIPWFGLIKLAIQGNNPEDGWTKVGRAYAPQDLWVCLGIVIGGIVAVPVAIDVSISIAHKRRRAKAMRERVNASTRVTTRDESGMGDEKDDVERGDDKKDKGEKEEMGG